MNSPMPWIKMFVDALDDPRLLRLTEVCRWRWVQLELMAGECDAEGLLITAGGPMSMDDIARRLRVKPFIFAKQMRSLETVGLVRHTAAGWQVVGFSERQGRKHSEKREQWRAAQDKARKDRATTGPEWPAEAPATTEVVPQDHPTTTEVVSRSYPTTTVGLPYSYPENGKSAEKSEGVINDGKQRVEGEKSREENKGMGADAPPPPVSQKVPSPKEPNPPSVEAFREAAGHYPTKALWQSMGEAIGSDPVNIDFWKQVVTGWIAKGWNPRNLSGMFDFYKRRELPGGAAYKSGAGATTSKYSDALSFLEKLEAAEHGN